ncbi:hypothetical protein [Sorangium sp. So ce176]
MNAPIDDEPDTEEELAAMAAGISGQCKSHAEVVAKLEALHRR